MPEKLDEETSSSLHAWHGGRLIRNARLEDLLYGDALAPCSILRLEIQAGAAH